MATPLTDKDFGSESLTDSDFLTDKDFEQPGQSASDILNSTNITPGGVRAGVGTVGALYGLGKGYEALAPQRTKIAGKLIDSIIKPRHKDFLFGKNPGKGVAQEGIWGINLNSIGKQIDKRLGELNLYSKELRSLDENRGKVVNLENAIDPLIKTVTELGRAPETHKTQIEDIYARVRDLEKNIPEGISNEKVPLEIAHGIKDVVKDMQKWGSESTADNKLNSALKQVYHNVDSAIDEVIPGLAKTNSRIANLISAKQAISHRMEILSRQDPAKLLNLINSIPNIISNTATKSGIAKILSEKFGMAKSVGSKIAGFYPMISQALQFATDPEAAQVGIFGGELAPRGSEERQIQLGQIT